MENIINFNLNIMGSSDKLSMIKVLNCYNNLFINNLIDCDIFETGFNTNTGYVYIALDNNITICSSFGYDAEFLVTDFDNGNEEFFFKYEDAVAYELNELNN